MAARFYQSPAGLDGTKQADCAEPVRRHGSRDTTLRYPRCMWRLDQPADPDPVIETYKRDVDRTLLRENLRRTVEERIEALMRAQQLAQEFRRAVQAGPE